MKEKKNYLATYDKRAIIFANEGGNLGHGEHLDLLHFYGDLPFPHKVISSYHNQQPKSKQRGDFHPCQNSQCYGLSKLTTLSMDLW